jgi:hypothetical protein
VLITRWAGGAEKRRQPMREIGMFERDRRFNQGKSACADARAEDGNYA